MFALPCHGCGREMRFDDAEIGQTFECAGCGYGVVAATPTPSPVFYHTELPTTKRTLAALVALSVAACLTLGVAVFFLVIVASKRGSEGADVANGQASPTARPPELRLTVTELSHKYENDPDAAERDLKGKVLELTGKAYHVDGKTVIFLAVATVATFPLDRVECRLAKSDPFARILAERVITLQGRWEGRDAAHEGRMTDCILITLSR